MMDSDLHILQHSLGVDQHGRGDMYRSHFVTGPGTDDYPICMDLVARGLMTRHAGNELSGGSDIFYVTQAGKAYVIQHSPAPPKLTRAQKRYQQWLDEDGSSGFGTWLKRGWYKEGAA